MSQLKEILKGMMNENIEFSEKRMKYVENELRITELDLEIKKEKQSIDDLKNKGDSLESLKRGYIDSAEKNYEIEVENTKKWRKEVEKTIKEEVSNKKSELYANFEDKKKKALNDNEEYLNGFSSNISRIQQDIQENSYALDELNKKISFANDEINQIKACIPHIESEYSKINKNEGFLKEYHASRGGAPKEAENKFSIMSDEKLIRTATEMNNGIYISSPEESSELPIGEIAIGTLGILGMILVGIIKILGMTFKGVYRPVVKIRKISNKIIYAVVISCIIFSVASWLLVEFGDVILSIIALSLVILVMIFAGMLLYNIIKYSDKTKRKEANLEYYTVGFYFLNYRDEILFRLAKAYYMKLKENSPEQLEDIINHHNGNIKNDKNNIENALEGLENELTSAKEAYTKAELVYKEQLKKIQNEYEIDKTTCDSNLVSLKNKRIEDTQREYNHRLEISKKRLDEVKKNSEQNAIDEKSNCQRDIEIHSKNLLKLFDEREKIDSANKKLLERVDILQKENRSLYYELQEVELDAIDKRVDHDRLSKEFLVGIEKNKEVINTHTSQYCLYTPNYLSHDFVPVIIVFDGEEEEAAKVTKTYYTMLDFMFANMLTETYLGAFKYILIDSKGNKNNILMNMKYTGDSYEAMQNIDAIEIINTRADKEVENIILDREKELNGKSIEDINKINKNQDTMIKYIILSIRVYNKQGIDFDMKQLNKRLSSCVNIGIIPIILISKEVFEKEYNNVQLPIRDLCGGRYYYWNLREANDADLKLEPRML